LLDKAIQQRYDGLRRWRTETAAARGVDADIVLPNSTLLAIAQQNPVSAEALRSIAGLTPWKIQTYAPPILAVLHPSAAPDD
jgi:ribonuclease D